MEDNINKKEWKPPVLEVLDINMTMAGFASNQIDANYIGSHPRDLPYIS